MSCQQYNFNVTQGCSILTYLTVTDSLNNPINLSGYQIRGLVNNFYSDTGFLYNLNPQISNAMSGIIMISGSASSTTGLVVGSYNYDVETYNGDYALKVLRGDFNVFPSTSF